MRAKQRATPRRERNLRYPTATSDNRSRAALTQRRGAQEGEGAEEGESEGTAEAEDGAEGKEDL